jgi:hypothetical protein
MDDRNVDVKYSEHMKAELSREFDKIDHNYDGYLDKEEITKLLDGRSSAGVFDRDILNYLFNQINAKDHHSDDRISKSEFCDTYIELNIFFHDRVYEFDFKSNEINKAIGEYQNQLNEAQDTERTNRYGIMDDSTLTATVIEGINLKAMDFNGVSDPYCVLQVENQMEQTNCQKKTLNPTWDQTFTFRIERGNEILKLVVMDKDWNADSDDFLGQCAIGVDMLRDQQKVEKYLTLQSDNPYEKWQGRVRVELRWIHSVAKLLRDLIQEHKNEHQRTQDLKKEYQEKIYKLQSPFWWMDKNQIKELENGDIESYEYRNDSVKRNLGTVLTTERVYSSKMDGVTNPISSLIGFKETPWFD